MRNWTIKEAVDTIREGTDFAGMKEIAAFNPVFLKDCSDCLVPHHNYDYVVDKLRMKGKQNNED